MENERKVIDSFFDGRLEEMAELTYNEKEELREKRDSICMDDYVQDLTPRQKKQVAEYIEDTISEVYLKVVKLNKKYYSYGFSDGVHMAIESFKIRPEIERRFSNEKS